LVQTFAPEHPGIALAAAHNYERFAEIEMGQRKAHGYPPFQRLARLVIRGKDLQAASSFAERLAGGFREALERLKNASSGPPPIRLLGPTEAPVFRLKGYYRFHFQLHSASPGTLHQLLRQVMASVRTPSQVDLVVDIDPQDML
jgi:primosomal protein N' (replication factor Y)